MRTPEDDSSKSLTSVKAAGGDSGYLTARYNLIHSAQRPIPYAGGGIIAGGAAAEVLSFARD